jgi:trehalose-phosphatase
MTTALKELMEIMLNRYRHGQHLALLFDYDGTLVPLTSHPRLAIMAPRTRRLLRRLAARSRIALGVLSGRELDELRTLVSLRNIYYAGNSGIRLDLRGTRVSHPGIQDILPAVTALTKRLQPLIDEFPEAWLESKLAGLTIHFRNVPEEKLADMQRKIDDLLEPCSHIFRFTEGPKAIEIVPELGWDKGTAVQFILEDLGRNDIFPLYAGDAPNDDSAFESVGERGGICLGIGPDVPPFVHYRMNEPADLFSFLAILDKQLAAEEPGGMRFASRPSALFGLYRSSLSTFRM